MFCHGLHETGSGKGSGTGSGDGLSASQRDASSGVPGSHIVNNDKAFQYLHLTHLQFLVGSPRTTKIAEDSDIR
jgi:hypothetical protein